MRTPNLAAPVLAALTLVIVACGTTDDPSSAAPTDGDARSAEQPSDTDEDLGVENVDADAQDAAPSEPATAPVDAVVCGEDSYHDGVIGVMTQPSDDAMVTTGFGVTGCTNAPDAQVLWELTTPEGDAISDGEATATCGDGCVGDFTFLVDYGESHTGEATLRLSYDHPEDGDRRMLDEVAVMLC